MALTNKDALAENVNDPMYMSQRMPQLPYSHLAGLRPVFPRFAQPLPFRPGTLLSTSAAYFAVAPRNTAVIGDLNNEFAAAPASDPTFVNNPITNPITTYVESCPLVFTSPSMAPSPWPKSAVFNSQSFPGSRPRISSETVSNTESSNARPTAASNQDTFSVPSPPPPTCVRPTFTSRNMLPTPMLRALAHDLPSRSFNTPSIPSAASSKFDITSPVSVRMRTSTDPLHSRSPYAQLLKYVSGYQTVDATALQWPPLVPIPEPSGYLSRALVQYQGSGKVYLLQVFQERLMSVQHELNVAEDALLVARAEQAAIEEKISSLLGSPVLEDEEKRLADGNLGTEGGVSLSEIEIEDQTGKDAEEGTAAVGDVKWWIGVQELRRERDVQLSNCNRIVKDIETKKEEVQSLHRDVGFLKVMISVHDALEKKVLVPDRRPFESAPLI